MSRVIWTSAAPLGVRKESLVGFTDIRVSFALESTAGDEKLALLAKLTERYVVSADSRVESERHSR